MGWFWASPAETPAELQPQALEKREKLGGIFWATPLEPSQHSGTAATTSSIFACPVRHTPAQPKTSTPERASEAAVCPVRHTPPPSSGTESKCPIDHSGLAGKFNTLNNMPELGDSRVPGQSIHLPTDRVMSSIPKGQEDTGGNWEYPSPQQMLNAMVRKSGSSADIPEDAVESMVNVHNFLNEGVWQEVLRWEQPYTAESHIGPRLLRFTGRPHDMSPRAWMLQQLGKIFPAKFGIPPPFDRHDWTVLRATSTEPSQWKQVRYVIDFYEVPDEGDAPAFSVDVRPALDSLQSVGDRLRMACGPVWDRAMGRA